MKTRKELMASGYDFEPSNHFSDGWKLLSKHFGPLIGMTLLFLILGGVISSIPMVSSFANIIGVILTAGIYIFLHNSRTNKNDAKDFFAGFRFTVDIIAHRLVVLLFLLPIILLLFIIGFPFIELFQVISQAITPEEFSELLAEEIGENSGIFALSILLLAILGVYLEVSYIFTIPLIVVGKMKFWEAMETSRKVVAQRFWPIFFSLIVFCLILGFMVVATCGLGILVALPVYSCVVYCGFEAIFKLDDDYNQKSELDEFGDSPDDFNSESEFTLK